MKIFDMISSHWLGHHCDVFSVVGICLLWSLTGETLCGQVPDLTQTVEFERKGDFHLGPTGAKGWIHTGSDFMTTAARQILITEVESGSAADGKLQVRCRPGDRR